MVMTFMKKQTFPTHPGLQNSQYFWEGQGSESSYMKIYTEGENGDL